MVVSPVTQPFATLARTIPFNNPDAHSRTLGKDLSRLTADDLQPVDEFHIRGSAATRELIELSGFTSDMHILDVGCGIGGRCR